MPGGGDQPVPEATTRSVGVPEPEDVDAAKDRVGDRIGNAPIHVDPGGHRLRDLVEPSGVGRAHRDGVPEEPGRLRVLMLRDEVVLPERPEQHPGSGEHGGHEPARRWRPRLVPQQRPLPQVHRAVALDGAQAAYSFHLESAGPGDPPGCPVAHEGLPVQTRE